MSLLVGLNSTASEKQAAEILLLHIDMERTSYRLGLSQVSYLSHLQCYLLIWLVPTYLYLVYCVIDWAFYCFPDASFDKFYVNGPFKTESFL